MERLQRAAPELYSTMGFPGVGIGANVGANTTAASPTSTTNTPTTTTTESTTTQSTPMSKIFLDLERAGFARDPKDDL